MLLQNLMQQQQQAYAQIQSQIEQLQEQQRQVQAYLQQLGSVESQMLSAAQVIEEAIVSINQVCPGELENYKQLIISLFNVIPQLEAHKPDDLTEENIEEESEVLNPEVETESDSPDNDPDNDPTPPGNSDNAEDSIDVEAEVVTQQPVLTLIKGAVASLSYQQIKEVMLDYKLETKGKAIKLKEHFIDYCERRTEQQQQGIWKYLTNLVPDLANAA